MRLNKLANLDEIREKKMAGDLVGIDYERPAKENKKRDTIDG
ncbi:hypothetical protein [Nitrosomonas ureae]|nr:hypothetical protein [Nitrosomonas ureae]SOD16475.1 hypothetical protein SAMN06297164_0555 [Nitrosomonas ureae]